MVSTAIPASRPGQATGSHAQHRTAEQRTQDQAGAGGNVGDTERWLSVLGGGALALAALRQGNWFLGLLGGLIVHRGVSGHCYLYGALGIDTTKGTGPATAVPAGHGVKVEHAVTIDRPPAELYRFWRAFDNLPRIMKHVESVKVDGNRSHWIARALGTEVSWDAEVYNEKENELIAWRSLPGSQVNTAGSVHFTPVGGGRSTEVRVNLKYDPPAGQVGAFLARLFGEAPEQQIRADLSRFKLLMEEGSAATTGRR